MVNRLAICTAIFLLLFTSCSSIKNSSNQNPVDTQDFLMGTVISQRVYGENAKKAANEVSKEMKNIESTMTINSPGGEINKLNSSAGAGSAKLSKDTIGLLKTAEKYAQLSDGAFDVTVGPLVKAWGIFTDNPRIPSQDELARLKKLVSYTDLRIDENTLTARLERKGQIVDLGGIAKGYAGDVAINTYKKYGLKSAFVNLGGNVVVLGNKPDGTPWKIGIQNPRAENGKYIGIVSVADKAVVSSGDYERFFMRDNKRYHHIIDPKTGYPSESGLIGTTIISSSSTEADALSTATFVLGLDKGMKLVESLKGVEAIFVTNDKKVYTTPGLKDIFIFDDESKEFTYAEKR